MNERFAKFGIFILYGYIFISLNTSIDKENERTAKFRNIYSNLALILKTSIDKDNERIAKLEIFIL